MRSSRGYLAFLLHVTCKKVLNSISCSLLFSLVVLATCAQTLHAAEHEILEGKIKAAYLYNFLRFVDWPQSPDLSFKLCVGGDKKEYRQSLQVLSTQTVQEQRIDVTYIDFINGTDIAQLKQCNMIFITSLMREQQDKIINNITGSKTLTIGEDKDFIQKGGMINFVEQQDKIKFEVNLNAINQIQLKISSKVLRIATRVIE